MWEIVSSFVAFLENLNFTTTEEKCGMDFSLWIRNGPFQVTVFLHDWLSNSNYYLFQITFWLATPITHFKYSVSKIVLTFHCLNKLFYLVISFFFVNLRLKAKNLQKYFLITRPICLTAVGQNKFPNKISFLKTLLTSLFLLESDK